MVVQASDFFFTPVRSPRFARRPLPTGGKVKRTIPIKGPRHGSEQDVAALLKSAAIECKYEPTEFSLVDASGKTVGFRPDYYLPDHDLYLEVTDGKDSVIREKQHKIAWMMKQHGILVILIHYTDLANLRSPEAIIRFLKRHETAKRAR